MLHRTRNLGVVGTRGGGLIAWTKGAYGAAKSAIIRIKIMITQSGEQIIAEDGVTNIAPER